ncbi:MAG: hypothetical protein WBB07_04425 [Mycobacterium sp.]
MTHNRAAMEMLFNTSVRQATPSAATPSRWRRLQARALAPRLDHIIDRGTPICPGSVLAAHAARLASPEEHRQLASSLRSVRRAALQSHSGLTLRVRLDRAAVLADAALLEEITVRLETSPPVRPRGVARLRLLLGDGCGPLYGPVHRPHRGSLAAQLRGVLAAL